MGNYTTTLRNQTNVTHSYSFLYDPIGTGAASSGSLGPNESSEISQEGKPSIVFVKRGRHSQYQCQDDPDLKIKYDGAKMPVLCIRAIEGGRKVQLTCNKRDERHWPTYKV